MYSAQAFHLPLCLRAVRKRCLAVYLPYSSKCSRQTDFSLAHSFFALVFRKEQTAEIRSA